MVLSNDEQNGLTKFLTGKMYEYTYTSGMSVLLNFSEDKANWEILAGPNKGTSGSNDYLARIVDNGAYFVQWNEPDEKITVTLLIYEQTKKIYGSVVFPDGLDFDVADIHRTNNL